MAGSPDLCPRCGRYITEPCPCPELPAGQLATSPLAPGQGSVAWAIAQMDAAEEERKAEAAAKQVKTQFHDPTVHRRQGAGAGTSRSSASIPRLPGIAEVTLANLRQHGFTSAYDVLAHPVRLQAVPGIGPARAATLRAWAEANATSEDREVLARQGQGILLLAVLAVVVLAVLLAL